MNSLTNTFMDVVKSQKPQETATIGHIPEQFRNT